MSTNEPMTQERLDAIQGRVDSVEFPDDEHLTVVNGEKNLVSWVERSHRDGSVVSGAVVATVHAGPQSAEMFAHAPEDISALLAEVERLRDELAKAGEVTEDKVERVLHAVKPYVSDRLADMDAEDMAWDATRAALDALLGGEQA